MRKRIMLGTVAVATVGLISAFATSAYATPGKTSACSNCHSGTALAVSATQTSNDGTNASYSVSAPGAGYIAVFSGGTKIAQVTGASGTITVADGKTYTLHAVKGPKTSSGYGSKSISPVAPAPVPVPVPVPDPTPVPVPVPDPTPVPVPDPTPVPVPTPDPTPAPVPVPGATTAVLKVRVLNSHGDAIRKAMVTVTNVATGETFTAKADSHGRVTFNGLALAVYRVTATSGKYSGKATIELEHNRSLKLKLKKSKSEHSEHHDD